MKHLHKQILGRANRIPGITRGIDSNLERGDTDVVPIMDTTFDRNGRTWRVSVVAGTFVIGTAVDAKRDANGEVSRESDIIRVVL